jgi:zinc protease
MNEKSGDHRGLRTRGAGRLFGAVILVWLALAPVFAAGPYLAPGQPDGLALLAPPPAAGSEEQAADLASALAIFNGRTPAEEATAKAEENLSIFSFAPAIGTNFQAGRFPQTEALLKEVRKETSTVVGIPKNHYQRPRPFLVDQRLLLGEPESGFSYPSGHATFGTVEAALLTELYPQHTEAILETGRNLGWHRVLTGKHYPTDIYAGRVLGWAIVRELKGSEAFRHDFAACAAELAGVAAAPAVTKQEENVFRSTLSNGLRVIIVRNPLAPVVTTVINYLVGSDECPEGFPGTAHAMEHMMFRGSPGLSADQLADTAAGLGGDFNADTQQALTQYFFTAPSEHLEVALRIEASRMRGILSTEPLWDKERGAIEQEVAQDLSNPEYVFYMKLLQSMFKGTPYEHDALGTRPSFDKTTGAMLKEFHNTWYAPNNAILIVCGDVQPAKTLEEVKKFFGNIPSSKLSPRPEFPFQPVKPETQTYDTDLPYGIAAITFRFPGSDSPDYAPAQILTDVLSSQRGKLYALVPEGKALFAGFEYEGLPKSGLGYAVAGFPAGADATNLVDQVRNILAAELTNGVLPDLVAAAKRRQIAAAEFAKNSVSGLAMSWSQAVAGEGRQSPDDDIQAMRRVTVEDVNRVAKSCLHFDQAITAILTPQPSDKPISSKSFGGQESFASSKTTGARLPGWARRATREIAIPDSTLNPVVTDLANGIRLIVQPESISDTVSVFGRVKSNAKVEAPAGKDGVDRALGELFSHGTKSLDRLSFQKALDDIGAIESPGEDFSLQVLTDQFERGVQLLAENEIAPALPEDDFKIIQPQLAASAAGELKSPDHLSGRALRAALFPKSDPAQRETTPETITALTIQDVRDYHQKVFRPDLTTIVVIGNVTPATAQAVILKYFGDWQASGPKPNTLYPPAPTNATSATEVPDSSRVQVKANLAETLTLTRTNADYYALQLGNHVLGGAFYASRLYRDLREKSGLVYNVSSSFNVGLTRSIYEVDYACDPPNVSKARAIVVNNLNEISRKPVTAHELRQAKVLLLRDIPLSESSVERVASGWLSRSILDLPLDEPVRAAKIYVNLTARDVKAAYGKWLRPDDLVQITQGPSPK